MTITPTTVAGTIFAIGIIAALVRAARNAPVGYEDDERGFRYGEPPADGGPAFVIHAKNTGKSVSYQSGEVVTPDEPGEEMTVEQLERIYGGDR